MYRENVVYPYVTKYYLAIKINNDKGDGVKLKNIMLCERNQTQNTIYYMIPFYMKCLDKTNLYGE